MFRRSPRWEDPGVSGERDPDGWYHYEGAAFAAVAPVRAAIGEAPEHFVDLYDPSAPPVPREQFLGSIEFATKDGKTWDVGISDDHFGALDDGEDDPNDDDPDGNDLVTVLLREQPQIRFAIHPDREIYQLATDGRLTASHVVASMFRAVAQAHRQLGD